MSKLLIFFMSISSFCFSYSQDFEQSMDLYWMMYDREAFDSADSYLTYLIETEYTPNIDKVNYMMYKHVYYLSIGDEEKMISNKKLMDALCDFDPACQEEKNRNWNFFLYGDIKY